MSDSLQNKLDTGTTSSSAVKQVAFVETDEERRARLKRPVGALDAVIIKQACPDIPDDVIYRMMYGSR